ncbi:MAG: helix-turn-helix domain-containing protein [Candidatus Palauibacterales bacterium]|nr:helix-turn-helix domain-containing protein [Candidatus Palauibacterales bacterium]
MEEIGDRLREVRSQRGLSLRVFASALRKRAGYEVTHSTVRKYENGQSAPATYLRAVARAFSVDAAWLLEGEESGEGPEELRDVTEVRQRLEELLNHIVPPEGDAHPLARDEEEVDAEWESASRDWDPDLTPSPLVIRSHERSKEARVPREAHEVSFRRVEENEFERRREHSGELLEAALPHLHWFSGLLGSVPHVVYLTDEEGVILEAEGNQELIDRWRVAPGYDWSESQMGTNGAGTALVSGRPVAVIAGEHYNRAFADTTCVGAPIRDSDGNIRGALDVATKTKFGCPRRLLPVVYCAWAIGREL